MLEEFIDNAKLLVATLGYKSFETLEPQIEETIKFYISAARGAEAVGTIVSDGFIVFKGSTVASSTTSSMSDNLKNFRAKLYADGIIDSNNKFVEDYLFSSPSYAAAIVMGRNANGKTEWKTADRQNIHDIESQ